MAESQFDNRPREDRPCASGTGSAPTAWSLLRPFLLVGAPPPGPPALRASLLQGPHDHHGDHEEDGNRDDQTLDDPESTARCIHSGDEPAFSSAAETVWTSTSRWDGFTR